MKKYSEDLIEFILKSRPKSSFLGIGGSYMAGYQTDSYDIDVLCLYLDSDSYDFKYTCEVYLRTQVEFLEMSFLAYRKLLDSCRDPYFYMKLVLIDPIYGNLLDIDINEKKYIFGEMYMSCISDEALKMYNRLNSIISEKSQLQSVFHIRAMASLFIERYLFFLGNTYIKKQWLMERVKSTSGFNSDVFDLFIEINSLSLNSESIVKESYDLLLKINQIINSLVFDFHSGADGFMFIHNKGKDLFVFEDRCKAKLLPRIQIGIH